MEEKRQRGRPKSEKERQAIWVFLPIELYNAVKWFAQENRMTLTSGVAYLLEVGLKHTQGEK